MEFNEKLQQLRTGTVSYTHLMSGSCPKTRSICPSTEQTPKSSEKWWQWSAATKSIMAKPPVLKEQAAFLKLKDCAHYSRCGNKSYWVYFFQSFMLHGQENHQ